MAKEKHSGDKISEKTLHEILLDIKYRLNHLEDIEADNRDLIVKLVKQGNSIVNWLKQIDIEASIEDDYDDLESMRLPSSTKEDLKNSERIEHLKELVDTFLNKQKDLKDFEKELKKNKDMLTPGQVGDA